MLNSKGCQRKLMFKDGDIFLTKGHVCKYKGICEVAVIDATERRVDEATTGSSAKPILSAKVIALIH